MAAELPKITSSGGRFTNCVRFTDFEIALHPTVVAPAKTVKAPKKTSSPTAQDTTPVQTKAEPKPKLLPTGPVASAPPPVRFLLNDQNLLRSMTRVSLRRT